MVWPWFFAAGAVAFFVLGWPADALARNPSPRAGLAWGALTFVLPALIWLIAAAIEQDRHPNSESAGVVVFVIGCASSFPALIIGTLVARAVRSHRQLGGL
jgi:sugar phosphate permease